MDNSNKMILGFFLVFSFITSCASHQEILGDYVSDKGDNISIVLEKNNFVIVDKTESFRLPFKCCDTISYGKWKRYKNNFLLFNSPDNYNTYVLNMVVRENINSNSDSTTVLINNPIESHYEKFKEKYKELYYQLEISSNNPDFDVKLAQKKWDTNKIRFLKPEGTIINSLSLTIVPKSDISVRDIQSRVMTTLPTEILHRNSNSFDIEISDLTYQYITLLRLENYFVKIDKKVLLWNNIRFVKK